MMKRGLVLLLLIVTLLVPPSATAKEQARGLLFIPSLHLAAPLSERTEVHGVLDLSDLGTGVAHYGATGWPGNGYSPIILVSHLVLEDQQPGGFYELPELSIGARIVLATADTAYWYTVVSSQEVQIEDTSWLRLSPVAVGQEKLVLITCDGEYLGQGKFAARRVIVAEREG